MRDDKKNVCADSHIAIGGAAALNNKRSRGSPARDRRAEITRLSIATNTVPAAGPKTTAAVSVKTSEIEKLTGTFGILSTAQPLTSVTATSAHHCSGRRIVHDSANDSASTRHPAQKTV